MGGVTKKDTIRDENVRGSKRMVTSYKEDHREKGYGHVKRRIGGRLLRRMLECTRKETESKTRWKDSSKRDMESVG